MTHIPYYLLYYNEYMYGGEHFMTACTHPWLKMNIQYAFTSLKPMQYNA